MQFGIPTVVESAVMVNEALNLFIKKLQDEARSNDYLNELKEKDNYEEIKEALNPGDYNMIVTPKEIDELIDNMKEIVARRNVLDRKDIKNILYLFLFYGCKD